MFFFLTTHEPSWLEFMPVPLFVSYHRLARRGQPRRTTLPRARLPWAIDSGGFTELSQFGCWTIEPQEYLDDLRRFASEIGQLAWATPQDWMCEECVLWMTGLEIAEHQRRTVDSYTWFKAQAPDIPWIPVLQGYSLADYLECFKLYQSAGVDLLAEPVVGVGTMCRRQDTMPAVEIFRELARTGIRMHAFGVKQEGLELYGTLLESSDSLAWSTQGQHRRLPASAHSYFRGNLARHTTEQNCPDFALDWRGRLIDKYERSLAQQNLDNGPVERWAQTERKQAGADRHAKMMISNPYSFISMSALEGDQWMRLQVEQENKPTSYLANKAAFEILQPMGIAGGSIDDIMPGGGAIAGDKGRLYFVDGSGEIVLVGSTVSAEDLPKFRQRFRIV